MTATYNPAEVERLAREAREDDGRMPRAPWDHAPVEPPAGSCDLRGPECACKETEPAVWCWMHDGIAEWVPVDVADAIIRQRNNLRAMADQLEAARVRVAELEIALRGAEAAASHYQREVWKLAEMHNERAGRVASLESDLARLRSELDTEARANNPDVTIPASTSPA